MIPIAKALVVLMPMFSAACSSPGEDAKNTCDAEPYVACGCGCCQGVNPIDVCVDAAHGETMQDISDRDKAAAGSPTCANAGCSVPVRYSCC
jgi:hypothetical protein